MKILIVDDMVSRHSWFKKFFGKEGIELIHVYDYQSAIKQIDRGLDFDFIFLDHDLSEKSIMCDPYSCKEKTGSDIVKYLVRVCDDKDKKRFTVICHSHNPKGRERMESILSDNGFKAFNLKFSDIGKYVKVTKVVED